MYWACKIALEGEEGGEKQEEEERKEKKKFKKSARYCLLICILKK